MATFFWWTSWATSTERPGETVTYTQNCPDLHRRPDAGPRAHRALRRVARRGQGGRGEHDPVPEAVRRRALRRRAGADDPVRLPGVRDAREAARGVREPVPAARGGRGEGGQLRPDPQAEPVPLLLAAPAHRQLGQGVGRVPRAD